MTPAAALNRNASGSSARRRQTPAGPIAPPWVTVPPAAYGGTESVVDNLARGLREAGHDVVLFTVGSSSSPVERRSLFADPATPWGAAIPEAAHVLAAYESLGDVDIIHDHTELGPLVAGRSQVTRVPIVCTAHGRFTDLTRPVYAEIARTAAIVAISADQAARAGVPISAVIHHGIDTAAYLPGDGTGGYVAFVGRMSADKGVDRAVRIARKAGWPLRLVTKMRGTPPRSRTSRSTCGTCSTSRPWSYPWPSGSRCCATPPRSSTPSAGTSRSVS
ncbi:glycosyltransferase [Cumulibacter manganitolerans]|uniref:glycosyltransferase n=1 Tax=Cumulibacter manganitolerans TaxID=1884992 RepID=UPI001E3CA0FA|nr:glycosyltransferase [Cumulibacter manganitolerans]